MKRSAPLKRYTPLRARKGLTRSRREKPIRRVSRRQASLNSQYARLRKIFFQQPENQWCVVAKAGLISLSVYRTEMFPHDRPASDVHHMKGRGKFMLAVETWLPVSREGHNWIHSHPAEARARGWIKSREK